MMFRVLSVLMLVAACAQAHAADNVLRRHQAVFGEFNGVALSDTPDHLVVEGQLEGDLVGIMSTIAQPLFVQLRDGGDRYLGQSQFLSRDGFFVTSDTISLVQSPRSSLVSWSSEHVILVGTGAFRDASGVIQCGGSFDRSTGEIRLRFVGLVSLAGEEE